MKTATSRGPAGSAGWAAIVLAAAVAVVPAPLDAQEIGLPIGRTPDAVVIEDLDGKPVDLDRLIGDKPALIEFWATWCPLCAALAPRIAAAHERYGDRVEFVTIAVAVNESKRSIRRHLEDHPVPGHVLWDTDGRATRAFMAPSTSYVVVLDADGRVAYTGAGAEQDIAGALARALGDAAP
ncbi:MAG TPA: TlpA disulfide reductase family protein [Longimicrobiales bacterium]